MIARWIPITLLLATTTAYAESLHLSNAAPAECAMRRDLLVGAGALDLVAAASNKTSTASNDLTLNRWLALTPTPKPDLLDALGDLFEYAPIEDGLRIQTDIVHLMLPATRIIPFASLAKENRTGVGDTETSRLGVGVGTLFKLSRNASIGTEVLMFNTEKTQAESDKLFGDMKFLTRLQISF